MNISEFSEKKADGLAKLNLPEIEMPFNIKILWIDIVTSANISRRIYMGTHSHSFVEIHFVFSGNVNYICDDKTIKLCENEALIIPVDTEHRYLNCNSELLKASIAFSIDKQYNLIGRSITKTGFSKEVYENINWILRISDKKDAFVASIVSSRILEIIYSVLNEINAELPQNDEKKQDGRFLVAKQYISDNMDRLVKTEDVAKECCLSVKQMNRVFKTSSGYSLHQYITVTKLNYAKRLLKQKNYSIKEIGYMLGFGSESGFVSFFKRHQGISPGAYRNQKCLKN